MKDRLKILTTYPFLISLFLLLLNDLVLKKHFGNIITGKLSDFTGLFIFPIFIYVLINRNVKHIYLFTVLFFILWKSTLFQPVIDFFNSINIPINRVVDYSDYFALLILPLSYYFFKKSFECQIKISPYLISVISFFAFVATSVPTQEIKFKNPQYVLYNRNDTNVKQFFNKNIIQSSGIPKIYNIMESYGYGKLYDFDTLLLLKIEQINIDLSPPYINDSYQLTQYKKQLPELINMYFCEYPTANINFSLCKNQFLYRLYTETTIDLLNICNGRLNGIFCAINYAEKTIIKGNYINGLENGWWYYFEEFNSHYRLVKKEFYNNGELNETITRNYDKEEVIKNTLRSDFVSRVITSIIIFSMLMIVFIVLIYRNNKPIYRQSDDVFVSGTNTIIICSLIAPLIAFIISRIIIHEIPYMLSADIFAVILVFIFYYLVGTPLFLILLLVIKLKKNIDVLWLFFVYLFLMLLLNQIYFLINIT